MTSETKSRILCEHHLDGTMYRIGAGNNVFSKVVTCRQVTTSEDHGWPKGRGVRDVGGDFETFKIFMETNSELDRVYTTDVVVSTGDNGRYYEGVFFSDLGSIAPPSQFTTVGQPDTWYGGFVPSSSDAALDTAGSTLISMAIPTNPIADMSVSLAELYREGLPLMIGSAFMRDRASFFRSLGSEYLNFEFGWKPFISDIQSAARAITTSSDVLKQLERDSGRNVHRRRYLPKIQTVSTGQTISASGFGLDSQMYLKPSIRRSTTTTVRQQWFSGCFTYYFEPSRMTEVERIVKQARLLLGLELTPEVLWNLAPWSWLVDWVFNVGPVLHNLTAFQQDGLVMRYGYVMEYNSNVIDKYSSRGQLKAGTDLPTENAVRYSGIRKSRRKATPYGFGLDIGGFSTRQWAILAALGITRAPRTL